jgi:alpha 1,3-glucosidase
MVLSLGVAGMPFAGADVGGFFDSPEPELLVRWFQLGAWCYPFFRCHSHHDSRRREPYQFSGAYRDAIRRAIDDRYALVSYWYTLARHANLTGEPVVRPVWWEFPGDRRFADVEDIVMVGKGILVVPVLEESEKEKRVQVPFARWYDFRTMEERERKDGLMRFDVNIEAIPVLIRGGSIIPIKKWRRRTTFLQFRDPFMLLVGLDQEGTATGDLYIDDGMSFKFAKGQLIHRRFNYGAGVLSCRNYNPVQEKGEFFDGYDVVIEKIVVGGLAKEPAMVHNASGNAYETEFKNGVLTIHRANLPVKENWAIGFECEGEAPPELPFGDPAAGDDDDDEDDTPGQGEKKDGL